MKPEHSASCNIDGEGYPRTPDWFSGQLVDDDDIDQGVINLNQLQGVARPLILRITISGAFLALNCENQPHGFGTG
jgi:hypothetical protein